MRKKSRKNSFFAVGLILIMMVFSACGNTQPGDICSQYGEERCGEVEHSNYNGHWTEEMALRCDGWKFCVKERCGSNGICVMGNDQFGTGAHCIHYY